MKEKTKFQTDKFSDEKFCENLRLKDDLACKIACCIREQMALWYKCSPEEFAPNIKTQTIVNSRWAPITGEDVIADIEHEVSRIVGCPIEIDISQIQSFADHRSFFGKVSKEGAKTFGEWVKNLTHYLMQQVHQI